MSDLISRQAAIDAIHKVVYDFFDFAEDDSESPMTYKDIQLLDVNKAITTALRKLPSAQKHGKWTEEYDKDAPIFFQRRWVCSACHNWNTHGESRYCPHCGAKMEKSSGE